MKDEIKFMECDSCRNKPGSPYLCIGCLHNRQAIESLGKRGSPELPEEIGREWGFRNLVDTVNAIIRYLKANT